MCPMRIDVVSRKSLGLTGFIQYVIQVFIWMEWNGEVFGDIKFYKRKDYANEVKGKRKEYETISERNNRNNIHLS